MNLFEALRIQGLQWRGAWKPTAADALPALPDQQTVALVGMVGIVGSSFWPHFQASAFFSDGLPDPLDRWSRSIAIPLAQQYGARALFPFDGPPYLPFQSWADRAEPTQSSPLMLSIHPEYGLWHAYRFALALPQSAAVALDLLPAPTVTISADKPGSGLCADCNDQPCLHTCPVAAFGTENYEYEKCAAHLQTPQGEPCMQGGCLARRACPVGQPFQYQPEHAAFHMQAFVRAHGATC